MRVVKQRNEGESILTGGAEVTCSAGGVFLEASVGVMRSRWTEKVEHINAQGSLRLSEY